MSVISAIMRNNQFATLEQASILLLGEAISAVILNYIFLGEIITLNYIIGRVLLFFAIIIIVEPFRSNKNEVDLS